MTTVETPANAPKKTRRPAEGLPGELRTMGKEHTKLARQNYERITTKFGDPVAPVRRVRAKINKAELRKKAEGANQKLNAGMVKLGKTVGKTIEEVSGMTEALVHGVKARVAPKEKPRVKAIDVTDDEF